MSYDEKIDRLNDLKIEDFIWVIYIGIIVLSYYSNSLERKYILYNDMESKEKYRKIMIFIFSILIIVYLYFLKDSYSDIKNIDFNYPSESDRLLYLSFIGSLLIAISGFIFLYISIKDEDLNVELAFN
ncbi:MAG: hypothetical protein IJ565_04465 [Bacilli bacterium]|nr:hypothetical protein [Bacilli bacterium]